MPHAFTRTLLATLALAAAVACTHPVRSSGGWTEGSRQSGPYSRVLVLGVSPDVNQRCAFEDSMAQALQQMGTTAQASCVVLGSKEPLTREAVEKAIAAIGAEAVLATRPLGGSTQLKEGGTNESRGGGYYKATDYGYAYDYWGAYGVPVVYGEFQTAPAEFYLEGGGRVRTDVYQAGTAKLVYSAETEAERLESRAQGMVVVSGAIAEQLRRDGLIR
jgi:hypothetical protein